MAFKLVLSILLLFNIALGKSVEKPDTLYTDVIEFRQFLGDSDITNAEKFRTVINKLLDGDDFMKGILIELSIVCDKFVEIFNKVYFLIDTEVTEFRNTKKKTLLALRSNAKGLPDDVAKFFEIAQELVKLFKKEIQLIEKVIRSIFNKLSFL